MTYTPSEEFYHSSAIKILPYINIYSGLHWKKYEAGGVASFSRKGQKNKMNISAFINE
jgi:hypothetical protein